MQHLPAFGRDERQPELLSSRAQGLDHSGRPGPGRRMGQNEELLQATEMS